MNDKKQVAVGIDLGTTFSVVAHLDGHNKPETIRSSDGDLTTPSVVFFDRERPIVGKEAVKISILEPEYVVRCAKREVGKDYVHQSIRNEQLPPEVIQALILKKLKEDGELKLGEISQAVVTVPAFFNEPRRKSTQDAGQLAGLDVIDIINEPTAAAIAYGVQQGFLSESGATTTTTKERVLIYDLGGGTFDVTLLDIDGHQYNAIATAGDVFLGGIDWDQRIVDHVIGQFQQQHGVDLCEDPSTLQTLQEDAEDAKRSLSQRESVNLGVTYEGNRLRLELTRTEFESMTEDLVQRTLFTTQKLLDRAESSWDDLTRVLLVGGSSRMPMIQSMLEAQTNRPIDRSLDPDECVAHGAAIYAGILLDSMNGEHPQIQVTNVNSHDLGVLGIERETGMRRQRVLLPRNTPLPASGSARFTTRLENQEQVSVDVIEGGDASGNNATAIGRCLVTDLPAGLPAGTPVVVRFSYSQNGRLEVAANVTGTQQETSLIIERTSGLSSEEITYWRDRIRDGFTQEDLASVLAPDPLQSSDASEESRLAFDTEDTDVIFDTEHDDLGDEGDAEEFAVAENEPFQIEKEVPTAVKEPAVEIVEEAVKEPAVEIVEEVVEEPAVEIVEEVVEVVEEPVVEIVEEVVEVVEEPVVEIVEEVVEEPAVEIVEEVAEEVAKEAEVPADPIPVSAKTEAAESSEDDQDNFFASLENAMEKDPEPEASDQADPAEAVDDDLNDFFKNFD